MTILVPNMKILNLQMKVLTITIIPMKTVKIPTLWMNTWIDQSVENSDTEDISVLE